MPAETPAAAATIKTDPQEDPVSVLTEIENGLKDAVAKFEAVDKDALDKLDAIKANPETAAVLDVLASVAKAELPPGIITAAVSGLQVLTRLAGQQAPAQPAEPVAPVPSGPVVAGQA